MGKLKGSDLEAMEKESARLPPAPRRGGRNPLRAKVRHPDQLDRDQRLRSAARPPVVLHDEYEIALWAEDGSKVVRIVPGPYARAVAERDKAMASGKYWKCWLGTGRRT